jgi:alpha-galactosidase
MHEIVKEPILLIKTSWGGKSIHTDFRPPSAGLYPFHKGQAERYAEGKKKTVEEIIAAKAEATGHFYRLMAKHVKTVLADLGKYHPAYDKAAGYEIAGFVWFQGWNDMCDSHAYPRRHQPGGYKAYSDVLAHFIRDVRKEFKAPKMPFVIGVLGVGGPTSLYEGGIKSYQNIHQHYRDAMVAPAKLPEFAGNVTTVLTEKFWPHDVAAASEKGKKFQAEAQEALKKEQEKNPKLMGASAGNWWRDYAQKLMEKNMTAQERLAYSGRTNKDYHYLGCLKFYAQAGEAFAKANAKCSSFGER